MKKEKVYLKGYVVGHSADTLGYKGLQIQLENMDIVEVDKNMVYKITDEPQKPVVPQFVADWYEENKDDFEGNLFRCINTISSMYEDEELNDFENWVIEAHTEPFQTLVNMHQFGYTVDKEKRYYVRFKFIEDSYSYLTLIKHLHAWTLTNIKLDKKFRSEHTKKQLEDANFGWVFDCPGIEIEEVE